MPLVSMISVDNFQLARSVKPKDICDNAIETVKSLHEIHEMEAWIQAILFDTNSTPHGPAEIVDILTHKVSIKNHLGIAAFILKGRSYPIVRPSHVSHQIFRLEKIDGLEYSFFIASGNVLDGAKEQFISTSKRLGLHYCILDSHDLARLFIAFGYICPRDGEKIHGGKCYCGYSPPNLTSNIIQLDALNELRIAHSLNQKAGLVILPTAAGKTRISVIDTKSEKVNCCIYTAHTHEILQSAEEEFLREYKSIDVQKFSTKPDKLSIKKINLITIQTLVNNLDIFNDLKVDYLIVDEFHHAAAKSYKLSIEQLKPSFLLGLTATPFRGDRQDVLEICNNNVLVNYELRQGIEFGVLCPYHYFGCFDDIDYSNITHNGKNYDISDLERALIIPERDRAIIKKWQEKAENKATIAFCVSHNHARRVAQSFNKKGINADVYLSTSSTSDRQDLLDKLKSYELKVLCVVDILNEGVNLPYIECLLFLRPTESKRIFYQQLGRGLRRFVGKEYCIVIDFIGNFKNAYMALQNLGLEPFDEGDTNYNYQSYSSKDILNLPIGCNVEFDDKVIDIFGNQTLDPRLATRQNIGRILIHQYRKLEERLGRKPNKKDIDRNVILHSEFYEMVFGSWKNFQKIIEDIK